MLKLYKQTDDQLHYWETWEKDAKTGIIHWGVVGERGTQRQVFSGIFSGFQRIIQKEIDKQAAKGYHQIEIGDHQVLTIEYKINGLGTPSDLEKRARLQNRLSETLGWTGLGHCDGAGMGSGTMKVCCYVVNFEMAKRVIADDLSGTEFKDYIGINRGK